MANLLPLSEKKKIRKEYRIRLCIVVAGLFSMLFIVSIVLLSPSFILSSFKYSTAYKQLEMEKKKISDETEGIDPIKTAKKVNKQLAVLGKEGSFMPLSYETVTMIVKHKPDRVKIKSIFYDRGQSDGRISISGISKDRKTLLSFLQSLEGEEIFNKVELPISSFVNGEDIEFSISISIEQKKENILSENNEE